MTITPEDQIVGSWILIDGAMQLDDASKKIYRLIREELTSVAVANWRGLFVDRSRVYWEVTYPESELHRGGPKCLTKVSEMSARSIYDF